MVAASHRRDACRGASNPRNGRHPGSSLTPTHGRAPELFSVLDITTATAAMSEYQYFELQAIDRPLSEGNRKAVRDLSARARITATSFTNSYEWGDFKADPAKLMERWFDLHLYLANWGSRRLMIRLPTRMVNRHFIDTFLKEVDCAELRSVGENLI